LNSRIFDASRSLDSIYESGHQRYETACESWERINRGKKFPKFNWNKKYPGAESFDLSGVWANSRELETWTKSLSSERYTESSYRSRRGAVAILETHQPSQRKAPITGKEQAAPLISDFNVMAVDLFFRIGVHEFVFMNSEEIAHSPTSPEHLYQNYIIDILIPGLKDKPRIARPWYDDIDSLLKLSKPKPRSLDKSQLDRRGED